MKQKILDIANLKEKGLDVNEISKQTHLKIPYVRNIVRLLRKCRYCGIPTFGFRCMSCYTNKTNPLSARYNQKRYNIKNGG